LAPTVLCSIITPACSRDVAPREQRPAAALAHQDQTRAPSVLDRARESAVDDFERNPSRLTKQIDDVDGLIEGRSYDRAVVSFEAVTQRIRILNDSRLEGSPTLTAMERRLDKQRLALGPSLVANRAKAERRSAPKGVTMKNYLSIENGMPYAEVVEILGSSGTEMSRSSLGNVSTVMYGWRADGKGTMTAIFQNGELVTLAQSALP
jgi:hypothetical protein